MHFEPDGASQFAEYCLLHRRPKIEAQRREDCLVRWTKGHLDLVEKVKAKEDKKEAAQRKKATVDDLNGVGFSQSALSHYYSGLAAQQNFSALSGGYR